MTDSTKPPETTQLAVVETARTENGGAAATKEYEDPFWSYADLRQGQVRWNKVYPYRLRVWKRNGPQDWVPINDFSFVLPIAPESLTINVPFAINTTITLGGVVEEHNGAPIRTISISGTTGVLPLRGVVNPKGAQTRGSPGLLAGAAAGTIGGIGALQDSFGALTSGNTKASNTTVPDSDSAIEGTGYAQFKLLQRFLERYVTLKKTAEGRQCVLALELWKDQEIYFVSPVSFDLKRSAASPLEYPYSLVFKAWRRVPPGSAGGGDAIYHPPIAKDLNAIAKLKNTVEGARKVLNGARKTLSGIRADINESLMGPITEIAVFAKDLLGVGLQAADLPGSIIRDLKGPISAVAGIGNTLGEFKGVSNRFNRDVNGLKNQARDLEQAFVNLGVSSGVSETGGGSQPDANTGQTKQAITGGAAGGPGGGGTPEDGSPVHKAMENPEDHYDFLSTIDLGSLDLPLETQMKIEEERRRIRNLKREDFEEMRDTVAATLVDIENSVGLGNETYTRIYSQGTGIDAVKSQVREPTELDHDVIFAINEVLVEMNRLAVSSTINRDEVSPIDYIAGLATASGIAFTTPRSKFLVPFPYAHTLEQISLMYLGDPDRWHEIAALNGLQAPYVDETGFTLPLLTNGNGNTVTVADASRLFVNQPVWLSSSAVNRVKRRITKIETLNPGLVAVTVTGDSDMEQFTVGAGAAIQAFLPNTVNSQQSIFIPSDEEVDDEDYRLKSIPGVDYFDPLLRVGGIDLLLTQSGDLVITPDGDTRLAVGMTNIVQKVRLALDTVRGSLLHHPEYGFPSIVGESTANISAKDLLAAVKDLFNDDPTFTGVESAAIFKEGPVCKITLSVGIAGTQQVIPITVEVAR